MDTMLTVRDATPLDRQPVWSMFEPVVRAGETYALARDLPREAALDYWFAPGSQNRVAVVAGEVVGASYLRANQQGGGAHVANAAFVTATAWQGRGVARTLAQDALEQARRLGFTAIQFNFVVATNTRAVALWQSLGFEIVGRLPGAFSHPSAGLVDAFVMFRRL